MDRTKVVAFADDLIMAHALIKEASSISMKIAMYFQTLSVSVVLF
jgi:hypothetical protein